MLLGQRRNFLYESLALGLWNITSNKPITSNRPLTGIVKKYSAQPVCTHPSTLKKKAIASGKTLIITIVAIII
jgi:uncharacterized ferritin-like protein (DUF455 family)